jgi:hypothetical protein
MDNKELYQAPGTQVMQLTFEGMVCISGNNWGTEDLPGFVFEDIF